MKLTAIAGVVDEAKQLDYDIRRMERVRKERLESIILTQKKLREDMFLVDCQIGS